VQSAIPPLPTAFWIGWFTMLIALIYRANRSARIKEADHEPGNQTGAEAVQRAVRRRVAFAEAMITLSDAACKLFAWLCLNVDRYTGCIRITVAGMARALGKSEDQGNTQMRKLFRLLNRLFWL
jgi:hypothetical protein